MRFFVAPLLTLTLFMVSDASAFFGAFARATGGMANVNSGTCGGATGLWDSYCSGPSTNYAYGSGFGAYAYQTPPAPCGGGCCAQPTNSWWYGGGHRAGCSSCSRSGCGSSCGSSCNLGSHLRGLLTRLRSSCSCRSAGASWVGGGPLDSYAVSTAGGFDGGIDYGAIDNCCSNGCGGGCSNGGDAGGEVIMHSEAGAISEPTPALNEGGYTIIGS